ncbi:hypothetical protein [Vibrio sp. Hal054]|uniref:hypothetical protein n=1 Tax=Vibrio sp. Hal054 TaxID=3035158 RepID=UPI00301D7313
MKESFTLKELIEKYGKEPDLMITTDADALERSSVTDDIADMYAIFFHEKATGGCIVYGKYGYADKTWSIDPHLRYVVHHLAKLQIQRNADALSMPLSDAEQRLLKEASSTGGVLRKLLDAEERQLANEMVSRERFLFRYIAKRHFS